MIIEDYAIPIIKEALLEALDELPKIRKDAQRQQVRAKLERAIGLIQDREDELSA